MSTILTLYLDNSISFTLQAITSEQLTAGGELADVLYIKISVNTINDHLRPEDTVIKQEIEN